MKILNKLKIAPTNQVLRNIFILINGTIFAQVINLLLSPILTRIYTPSEFGQFAIINSIVIVLAAVANGKYDFALMAIKENSKSKLLFVTCIFIALLMSSIFFLIGVLINNLTDVAINLNNSDLILTAWLIFSFSNNNLITIWLNKHSLYKEISAMRVYYSIIYGGFSIILGLSNFGYLGLVYAMIGASISQNVYGLIKVYSKTPFNKEKLNIKLVKSLLLENKKYPLYVMPTILLNGASVQAPTILFGNIYSDEIAGWYSMTVRIINVPMMVIGNSIGNVFFKEASELYIEKNFIKLSEFTNDIFKKLVIFGSLFMSIFMVFGEIIFKTFLGDEWTVAGTYAMYLAPWYFMVFVTSPLSHLFNILGRQKSNLFLNVFMFLSRIFAIILGSILFVNGDQTVLLFSIVGFVIWLVVNGYTLKMVNIKIWKTLTYSLLIFIIFVMTMTVIKIGLYSIAEVLK